MAVKHVFIDGTSEEVQSVLNALPKRKTDRVLSDRPLYLHMRKHLGIDIREVWLSVATVTPAMVQVLQLAGNKYPCLLYRVTNARGTEVYLQNYDDVANGEKGFPGPFGALCLRYGKSYY